MLRVYIKMFFRSFLMQALWNFERLQNIGFAYVLKPFINELYKNEVDKKEAFLRHINFFNTQPYMANIIFAITTNIEKKIASNEIDKNFDINLVKNSMAGPLAAIGDSFFWGTLRPVLSFICIFLVIFFYKIFDNDISKYEVIIPVLFIVLYNMAHLPIRYWLLFAGLKLDKESIAFISKMEIKVMWNIFRYFGLLVVVGAIIMYFYTFGFAYESINFYENNNILSLVIGVSALALSFISAKFSATFIFYVVIFLSILMAYMGI